MKRKVLFESKKAFSVRLTPSMAELIEEMAKQTGECKTTLIRQLLKKQLKEEGNEGF